MKKLYLLIASVLLLSGSLHAQGVGTIAPLYNKPGTSTAQTIPLNQTSQQTQLIYEPGAFNTVPPNGSIRRIYFQSTAADASCTYTNFKVSFLQTTDVVFPGNAYYTGLTVAMDVPSITLTGSDVAGGWFEIALPAPYFQYDNTKSLVVEIQYTAKVGGISTNYSTSTGNIKRVSGQVVGAATGNTSGTWNNLGLEIIPTTPCSGPTAGDAVAYTTTPCGGDNVNLNLINNSLGSGQTFQWERSGSASGPWTNEGTVSNSPSIYVTPVGGITYYRAQITCGATTLPSQPVAIDMPLPLSGTNYTINPAAAASATNFTSFTALATKLACAGISGNVVVNVSAAGSPYNEQFKLTNIPGASASARLTINGNGATIANNATAATTGTRQTVGLDGASYVTISDLVIQANGATYGYGVHIGNGASFDTIKNCKITVASTSTTAANSSGIVCSGSQTTPTTEGLFNNIALIDNYVSGGIHGIILSGDDVAPAANNYIGNNILQDFYENGITMADVSANVVTGNDISRITRATVGGFAGIELSGASSGNRIAANRIHDSHNAATTQSGAAYGVYITGADATVGAENIVSNNLIYNLNSTTGTIYGLYNSSSNGAHYFHNTIVLDNAASTSGVTRGFYQATLATNIQLKNNIIYITRGGTGLKYGLYFGTTTSDIASNNNVIYVNAPAGTNGVGYYSSGQTTLANWQSVNGAIYDQNSSDKDPYFVYNSGSYYVPTNTQISNLGTPTVVTTDLGNAVRSATTPDAGAFEFEGCFSLASGTYTINDALPTGGTNFHSFPDMIAAMTCGISGNVTINVAAGSGPYTNQHLIFPPSLVTSAAQRITINGNGATLVSNSHEPSQRGTVTLYGTDYITINNLVIDATKGTYGWGVVLTGQADHNRIAGCTIRTSTTSTSNAFTGIALTPSLTSPSGHQGITGNFDTLINNTVIGGYYGISLYSVSTSLLEGNVVMNNTLQDQHSYGILVEDNNGIIISGNDISRPTRTTTVTTLRGIYFISEAGNNQQGGIIEKNKIHNMADAITTSFSSIGIDVVNTDAAAATPTIVRNNVIYNMNNVGTQSGLTNNSSDNTQYYYNTIVLDNTADASALTTAGFAQSNAATGIDFRNNLVYITRGGSGKRYGVNLMDATTATSLSGLNNNVYFINTAGGDNHIGSIAGTDYTTLANWQAAFTPNRELNSVSADPQFVNPGIGNFATTNLAVNNIATPIAGITVDIINTPRSTGFPDAGAFENSQFPLGVKLLSFAAVKKNSDVATHWDVTSESNMSLYEVERSYDGRSFAKVGAVTANGNANSASYNYLDRAAVTQTTGNVLYYRLKMMEHGGQYTYSPVRTIMLNGDRTTVAIHPNPFTDRLVVSVVSTEESEAKLKIVDVQGRVVYTNTQQVQKGMNTIDVSNLEPLAPGVYYITIDVNGAIFTEKLAK